MSDAILAFIHIERSAGTSMHSFLRQNLPGYYTESPPVFWPATNEPEMGIPASALSKLVRLTPGLTGIGGHSLRPWTSFPEGTRPVSMTVLRDPIERFLSHIALLNRFADAEWTIEELCRDRRLWNWQTVKLAGSESLDEAMAALDEIDCVGFHDQVGTFASEALEHLGVTPRVQLGHANVSHGRNGWEELSAAEQALVHEANSLDLELYRTAQARFRPWHLSDRSRNTFAGRGRRARMPDRVLVARQRAWSLMEAVVRRSELQIDSSTYKRRLLERTRTLFDSPDPLDSPGSPSDRVGTG